MLIILINKFDYRKNFLLILFKSVLTLSIKNLNNSIYSTSTLEIISITKKNSFTCPWYCYPAIIFSILISLIILTICISACDYRYSKKQQQQSKIISFENKNNKEKKIISNNKLNKSQDNDDDDDVISITSNTSSK